MNEIEGFLDECGGDPFFRAHPLKLDVVGNIMAKMYRASDGGPEWQAISDRILEIVTPKGRTPSERFKELFPLLLREFEQMVLAGKISNPRLRAPGGVYLNAKMDG